MTGSTETVLIIEDETQLAELYAVTLREEYDTVVAHSGPEGLDSVDDTVDVILLDRRMPGLSGREVLARLREEEYSCPVAMITAVTPDWDILDMPFDDYLVKPVDPSELRRVVERLLVYDSVDEQARSYIAKSVKQAAIEAEKDPSEIAENEAFDELADELAETSTDVGDVTADLSQRETELVIETITRSLRSVADQGDDDDGFSL